VPVPQWESYFWPSTQALKNKLGLKDEAALTAMERLHTTLQAERIASGLIAIDRTFDAAHIKAIHAALFSRIYTWAGEFRTVNMRRGVNEFASVADIPRVVDEMHRQVSETDWGVDDRDVFASNISTTAAIGNFAHAFRDGNGPGSHPDDARRRARRVARTRHPLIDSRRFLGGRFWVLTCGDHHQ